MVKVASSGTPIGEPVEPKATTAEDTLLGADIEFQLPSGKKIKMGRPTIPASLLLPTLMGSCEPSAMAAFKTEQLCRQVLHVKEINGQATRPIQTIDDVKWTGSQLGEDGLEAIELMYNKFFPSLTPDQLKIIKK